MPLISAHLIPPLTVLQWRVFAHVAHSDRRLITTCAYWIHAHWVLTIGTVFSCPGAEGRMVVTEEGDRLPRGYKTVLKSPRIDGVSSGNRWHLASP